MQQKHYPAQRCGLLAVGGMYNPWPSDSSCDLEGVTCSSQKGRFIPSQLTMSTIQYSLSKVPLLDKQMEDKVSKYREELTARQHVEMQSLISGAA